MELYDVAIVGAGVAGSATALALDKYKRALLIDPQASPSWSIGESLPGAASAMLRDLGLLDQFKKSKHLQSMGRSSIWGSDDLETTDGFLNPQGAGWRLDRKQFNCDLRTAANQRAEFMLGNVNLANRNSSQNSELAIINDDKISNIRARFIVDATGRSARIGRQFGSKRVSEDRLICRSMILPKRIASDLDGFSYVEAVEDGWWYHTVLPGGENLVAFHTDSDLPAARCTRTVLGFQEQYSKAKGLKNRLGEIDVEGNEVMRQSARSGGLDRPVGESWAAVGDAALCFDPISSQGIFHALYSGLMLGKAIDVYLNGDVEELAAYSKGLVRIADEQRRQRLAVYRSEMRFADSTFWKRRH